MQEPSRCRWWRTSWRGTIGGDSRHQPRTRDPTTRRQRKPPTQSLVQTPRVGRSIDFFSRPHPHRVHRIGFARAFAGRKLLQLSPATTAPTSGLPTRLPTTSSPSSSPTTRSPTTKVPTLVPTGRESWCGCLNRTSSRRQGGEIIALVDARNFAPGRSYALKFSYDTGKGEPYGVFSDYTPGAPVMVFPTPYWPGPTDVRVTVSLWFVTSETRSPIGGAAPSRPASCCSWASHHI